MHYCGCDIVLHSVVDVSDEDEVPVISDSSSWASLYRPLEPTLADPNKAPTEMAPSTPAVEEGETPSVPETPHLVRGLSEYCLECPLSIESSTQRHRI